MDPAPLKPSCFRQATALQHLRAPHGKWQRARLSVGPLQQPRADINRDFTAEDLEEHE